MGANRGGKKGEELRLAMDAALEPQAQPREGRNQVVAGTSLSWEHSRRSGK